MANGEATMAPKFVVKVAGDKKKKKVVITLKEDAKTILDGKEVVFSVIIYKKEMKINSVMSQVNYPAESKGYQYTGWYGYYYKWLPYFNLVPYYVEHKLNGCYSGSVAASWAVIFGYYDRRTHYGDWGYGSMEAESYTARVDRLTPLWTNCCAVSLKLESGIAETHIVNKY